MKISTLQPTRLLLQLLCRQQLPSKSKTYGETSDREAPKAGLAQLVEQLICNQFSYFVFRLCGKGFRWWVAGEGSKEASRKRVFVGFSTRCGGVREKNRGDCTVDWLEGLGYHAPGSLNWPQRREVWFAWLVRAMRDHTELDWMLCSRCPSLWLHALRCAYAVEQELGDQRRAKLARWWYQGNKPKNVWLGLSASRQADLDHLLEDLLLSPAGHYWLRLEDVREEINLTLVGVGEGMEVNALAPGMISLVVLAGCCEQAIELSIREQCEANGVAFERWPLC